MIHNLFRQNISKSFLRQRSIRRALMSVYIRMATVRSNVSTGFSRTSLDWHVWKRKDCSSGACSCLSEYATRHNGSSTVRFSPCTSHAAGLNMAGVGTRPAVTDTISVQKRVNLKQQKQKTHSTVKGFAKIEQLCTSDYT